jgi:hypothetical protein
MKRLPMLAVLFLVVGCDNESYGVKSVSDVSLVTAYFVTCDSVLSLNRCHGPMHRAETETFTVVVSRQAVLRRSAHLFHGCEVLEPRRWLCFDDQGNTVEMSGFEMRWVLIDADKQASISPKEYCEAPILNPFTHELVVPSKPDVWKCMR